MAEFLKTRSDCEIEFDHHSRAFALDPPAELRRAYEKCPITWTNHNGGHWLITGYKEAYEILQDDIAYSSADGVSIPPMLKPGPPLDVDPPLLKTYRRTLTPVLSVAGVAPLKDAIEGWTQDAIDAVIESGKCDLAYDIGSPVPAKVTMILLGLNLKDWPRYAKIWHEVMAHPRDPETYEGLALIRSELQATVVEREKCPASDAISVLWNSNLFDECAAARGASFSPVSECTELAMTLMGGGVDTTTNMFLATMLWLSNHPEERERLIAEPELMNTAVDEFFRFFATAPALARTVTEDHEFHGHAFAAGDRVLVSFMAANRDPRMFPNPDDVILDRWPNRHMTFGVGGHRCLGSNVARLIFPILLQKVFESMPDLQVVQEEIVKYDECSNVIGWVHMPATFTPRVLSSR